MLDGIVKLIQGFAQFLSQFIGAIFGGLGQGVQSLFLTPEGNQPSAFAYIAFMMIALSLAVGLTHWITNWIRGRLG